MRNRKKHKMVSSTLLSSPHYWHYQNSNTWWIYDATFQWVLFPVSFLLQSTWCRSPVPIATYFMPKSWFFLFPSLLSSKRCKICRQGVPLAKWVGNHFERSSANCSVTRSIMGGGCTVYWCREKTFSAYDYCDLSQKAMCLEARQKIPCWNESLHGDWVINRFLAYFVLIHYDLVLE